MSIIRNQAGQTIPLGAATDLAGALVTSTTGWTVTVSKDGVSAAAAGTLTYAGGYWYALTQGETDAAAILVLATRADTVPLDARAITQDHARSAVGEILADTAVIGTPAGASVAADLAAVKADTGEIGEAGAGLTQIGDTRLGNLDAAVSSRLAADAYTAPPTAQEVEDAVLDAALADHDAVGSVGAGIAAAQAAGDPWGASLPGDYAEGSAGRILGTTGTALASLAASLAALPAALWSHAPRTLTMTADQILAVITGSRLPLRTHETWSITRTGVGDLTGRTALYWALKRSANDADSAALVLIEESAGLKVIAGRAPIAGQTATLAYSAAAGGTVTITVSAAAAALVAKGSRHTAALKVITPTGSRTIEEPVVSVQQGVVRATS